MASPVSVSELVTAMMALKNMYDQHQENKQEVKVLQDFIAEYSEHVPSIQQALKDRKSTGVAVTVLNKLESDLEEATKQLKKWAADRNFFRVLKSTDRKDILAAITSLEEAITKYSDDFMDPILHTLMIDPVVATNGHTYCRWTIIDNNMIRDPHDPSKDLTIMVDNVNLRRGLFDMFPEQTEKYRQRRQEYRCKALSLARSNQLADAVVALQHVLKWNENDEECALAHDEVKEILKNIDIQHSHDMPDPSPSNGDQSLSRVGDSMIKKDTLEIPNWWAQDEVRLPDTGEGDDEADGTDGSTHPCAHTAENDELDLSKSEVEDTDASVSVEAEGSDTEAVYSEIGSLLKLTLKRRWFRGHSKTITSVHWSPGDYEIVTASKDKTVIIWEIKYRPSHEKPSGCLPSLRWQSDWKTEKVKQFYESRKQNLSGRVKMTLKGHSGPVNCVGYDVSGRWIASASSDKSAKIWNARTGSVVQTLRSHSDDVTCVAWSSLGYLATTSADCTTLIWDGKTETSIFAGVPKSGTWNTHNILRRAFTTSDVFGLVPERQLPGNCIC
nr:pre-mRNA-processing factor 19-like [Physcomitrium patens]|eukprot:XP_024373308.1 pre-mRNA-processing factor 19-like [Physcomitrella patens]